MIFYLVFEYFIIVSIGVVLFICGGRQLQNAMGAEPVTPMVPMASLLIQIILSHSCSYGVISSCEVKWIDVSEPG